MIGLYFRVSSGEQKKNWSLPDQNEKGIAFSNSISEQYTIYQDVESGEQFDKRDDFNQLWVDISKGLIQKVWIIHQSRIVRNVEDSQKIKKHFIKYNVELYINGSFIDFNDPNAVLYYNFSAVIDENEIVRLVQRTTAGKVKAINEGRQVFPRVFGYDYRYDVNGKKDYYINEDEAKIVKLIYQLFMEGLSFRKIEKTLNERMLFTKEGKNWTVQLLCRVLERPLYSGYVYNKKGELIKSQIYEPIISLEQYQTTRQYWHTVKKVNDPAIQFKHCDHQSSSIIRCCECNGTFVHVYQKDRRQKGVVVYDYYFGNHKKGCTKTKIDRNYLIAKHIDNIFSTLYYLTFSNSKEVVNLLKMKELKIREEENIINENKTRFEKMLDDIKKKQEKLIDLVEKTDSIEFSDIDKRMAILKDEEKSIKDKLNEANKNLRFIEEEYEIILNEFKEDSLLEYLHSKDGKKRKILLKIINKCYLEKSIINIKFITGKKYSVEIPENKKFQKVKNVYKIKIDDSVGKEYLYNAEKNTLRYSDDRADHKNILNWVKRTESLIKEGKALKPL